MASRSGDNNCPALDAPLTWAEARATPLNTKQLGASDLQKHN